MHRDLIIALVAGTVLLLVMIFAGRVEAHEWYDPVCCSGQDCAPIPVDAVAPGQMGYWIELDVGDHPLVQGPMRSFVRYGDNRVRPSEDGQWHACIVGASSGHPYVMCLYVPMAF